MSNAIEASYQEIRTENFDKKAKSDRLSDKNKVEANQSLKQEVLGKRDSANLKETNIWKAGSPTKRPIIMLRHRN